MTIVNGYCTLEEIRERLTIGKRRNATTISFDAGTKKIADTALGLVIFPTGARIRVQGSTSNDGYYTVATGGVAGELVVSEALTTEAAGGNVTITDVTDVQDDAKLESITEAISRAIEGELEGRRFYTTAEDETRYYTAEDAHILFCPDDILSITTLATDDDGDRTYEDAWAATDYDKCPFNAVAKGKPYTWLEVTPDGDYTFPVGVAKGVKIVGKFGYSSTTPAQVREVTLLLAEQLFKRKTAIFGVVSSPLGELRQIMREDPHINLLLLEFRPRGY